MTLALVADTGGTNTRVALADGPRLVAGSIRRYRNAEHADMESLLRGYLRERDHDAPLSGACVAVAGPVRDGVGRLTNLDWQMDRAMLGRATGADRLALLNDLQAQGHALDHLAPDALTRLLDGQRGARDAPRLVIGIGTGFNAAAVHTTPAGTLVTAAEAGHVTLPVETETDLRLAHFTQGEDRFSAVEDVLSGRGLSHVFGWVTSEAGSPAQATGAEIMMMMERGDSPAAIETARVFTRHLGIAAGNLALTFLPFGGIYLCGGVARAVAPYLLELGFAAAFREKGRFSGFMDAFGLSVIGDDYAALTGCAAHLAELKDRP